MSAENSAATRPFMAGRAAWLSLIGAVVILVLKGAAYLLTGSIGFLSDAAESLVNLVAAVVLLIALSVSRQPPDYEHPYGHTKAEYLSAVLEAALIILAAGLIIWSAVHRLLEPQALENVSMGVIVALIATVVNGGLALALSRVARRERSAALAANASHLFTDVYTSLGVIVAVGLVGVTGWHVLDPLIALVVAANIVRVGVEVMRRSISNLLDQRLPDSEEAIILAVLEKNTDIKGYHRLRTRRSGRARFAEFDVFVAPTMSVAEAHSVVARVEDQIHAELDDMVTTVHVEPYVEGVRDKSTSPREEFS